MLYKIVRFYVDPNKRKSTIRTGLYLEEARAHCNDRETSSRTATSANARAHTRKHGAWFDGYEACE
jgi:hypothetical protein